MPELVTPELTLVRLADKEALDKYATARTAAGARVNYQLKANLAQLLGFDQVGSDRKKRWEATDGTRGTFYNLADISWFYHAGIPEAIPLWCIKLPYQAPKAPNNLKAQDGSTIRGGTWIFDAYFFKSTSADQQRRSYTLLDGELVHVTVESLIQEADLDFDRDGMHDRILGDASHLKIMRHNFSNVVT